MDSEEAKRERMRQTMLKNLNRAAVASAAEKPVVASSDQSRRDAAALLEFGALLSALPDKGVEAGKVAQSLVESINLSRLGSAVKELRTLFESLHPGHPPSSASELDRSIKRSGEDFLEWLVRLDTQRALVGERAPDSKLKENRERWMAIDKAFGPATNFWAPFCQLRKRTDS